MSSAVRVLKNGKIHPQFRMPSIMTLLYVFGYAFIYPLHRNESHDKCPICQTNLSGINDSWVLSELPKTNEVNEEILTELNALTNDSSSEVADAHAHPHDHDDDSDDWIKSIWSNSFTKILLEFYIYFPNSLLSNQQFSDVCRAIWIGKFAKRTNWNRFTYPNEFGVSTWKYLAGKYWKRKGEWERWALSILKQTNAVGSAAIFSFIKSIFTAFYYHCRSSLEPNNNSITRTTNIVIWFIYRCCLLYRCYLRLILSTLLKKTQFRVPFDSKILHSCVF